MKSANTVSNNRQAVRARRYVGRRVRVTRTRDGIERGTCGKVVRAEHFARGEYDLVIRWELPPRQFCGWPRPVDDWFPLPDFERFFELAGACTGGHHA